MKKLFNQIIKNEKEYLSLSSNQFNNKKGITRANIEEKLKKRGDRVREIIAQTNEILSEHLMPFLVEPKNITPKLAVQLEELAEELSGYRESIDTGLSYDIRTALVIYAEDAKDYAMHIRNLFFKGLTLFYLDKELFIDEMDNCYNEIIAYSDRYKEFDRETRNLIVRAYGNSYISVKDRQIEEIERRSDRAIEFWMNVAKPIDPDFPWEAYLNNARENLTTNFISLTRSTNFAHTVTPKHVLKLKKNATELYNQLMQGREVADNDITSMSVKITYYKTVAEYLAGEKTAKELTDFLYKYYMTADKNSYDYDNIYMRLHIAALYIYYLRFVSEEEMPEELRREQLKKIEGEVFEYVLNVPGDVSQKFVTDMVKNFAVSCNIVYDDLAYLKMLLSLTVFRHKPTYVHSVMVAKISVIITEFLIENQPKILMDLPGISSVEDVIAQKNEILKFVWFAGLIHDIGKIPYSHIVSFYVRKLNDKEFEMIKQHTTSVSIFVAGGTTIDINSLKQRFEVIDDENDIGFIDNKQAFGYLAHIAIGHHKSYDGNFGYPREFDNRESEVKTIIDIITIADSIDAATDSVGRSYANKKKLHELISEFDEGAGTRYSPIIAKLLSENKSLCDEIEKALNTFRYDVYYSCFSGESFANTMEPPKNVFEKED